MSGQLNLVSPRLRSESAGVTGAAARPSIDVGVQLNEGTLPGFSALTTALSGGVHPEAVPLPTAVPIERATDSVRGRLGGLVPRPSGTQAPGPAGAGALTLERLLAPPRSTWERLVARYGRPSTGARS